MSIKLKGSTDGSVTLQAPADTSPTGTDKTLTLPTTVGSANQFVKNGGTAGQLEYSSMVETSTGNVQARRARSNTAGDVALSVQPSDSSIHYGLRIDAANNNLNLDKVSGTAANLLAIDSSGNVGIGSTTITNPYSQSNFTDVNIDGVWGGIISFKLGGVEQGWIGQRNSGNQEMILGASSGKNLLFATNGNNERMRIDSSGNVGIGTTSIASGGAGSTNLNVHTPSATSVYLKLSNSSTGNTSSDGFDLSEDSSGNAYLINRENGNMQFYTNATERMRIRGNGYTRFSSDTADSEFYSNSGPFHAMHSSTGDSATLIVENSHNTAPYGILIDFSDSSPDNNSNYFIRCADSTQANRMVVYADGDIDNHDNSYSGLSDLKLKQDIVDAGSQWDDIKDLRVRKFKFKSDVAAYGDEAKTLIGVVAQETELVSPGLVKETPDVDENNNDLGTTTKSVRYSVLYMKAIKALQEAMDRIETLETQQADLLARVTALEAAK